MNIDALGKRRLLCFGNATALRFVDHNAQVGGVRAVGRRRFAAADMAVPESHPRINSSGVTNCSYDTSYGVILETYSATPR